MQQSQETTSQDIVPGRFFIVFTTLLILVSALPLSGSSVAFGPSSDLKRSPISLLAATRIVKYPWDGDTKITPAAFDFSLPGANSQPFGVSPLFSDYYHKHSGVTSLGAPLTAAFRTEQGWIQFFPSGALLLPVVQAKHLPDETDSPNSLVGVIDDGMRDPNTGIIRLSLLETLLMSGSEASITPGSSLTYLDLRGAATPSSMVAADAGRNGAEAALNLDPAFFVGEGMRAAKTVGHFIPLSIWSYIQRADVSPDGWQTDFGAPLTEALAFSVVEGGVVHQMLVQAFWSDAIVLDQSVPGAASGQSSISRLASGLAYLRTFGPPPVVAGPQQSVWTQANTTIVSNPETSVAVAHVRETFPLALQGDSSWEAGRLWYQVQWTTPHHTFTGWMDASALSFASPGHVPGWASIDALSPELASYLAGEGGNVGVAIYDLTRQRYYTWQADDQFITGSSIKVPIMLTLLDMTEREGREPDQDELALLTTMIENSNNDAAGILYNGEVGSAWGVTSYLQSIGISGLDATPGAFGWSLITPLSMVNLLTRLEQGTILTVQDRTLALSLMENIEPDQQVGVGDTAPPGATVAMKDGWVIGPDGLWTMNSSGIVTLGQETYLIAVYTQGQSSLPDGQGIVQTVCGAVAALLT